MNTPLPAPVLDLVLEQYLVSHGKSGAVGVFGTPEPLRLRRGSQVVLQTPRGVEAGCVLGPATLRQARLLGAQSSGRLLRSFTAEDDLRSQSAERLSQQVFQASRSKSHGCEILDVEVLLDARQAILQYVGADDRLDDFAESLERDFHLAIRFENLATPLPADDPDHNAGCGETNCGRANGGSCSSCETGGGCSSCGSGKVDMKAYFSHLRDKMETQQRTPLL